jgi:hypothetical protein
MMKPFRGKPNVNHAFTFVNHLINGDGKNHCLIPVMKRLYLCFLQSAVQFYHTSRQA